MQPAALGHACTGVGDQGAGADTRGGGGVNLRELHEGAIFLVESFGPDGDRWRVMEWWTDTAGVRAVCLAENIDHPDEETFAADEEVYRWCLKEGE